MNYRITKFTPAQIAAIMEMREMGLYWHEIANRYNVRSTYIQSCVRRAEVHGMAIFAKRRAA